MRVLILHSDIADTAAPDELDTLVTANAIAEGLRQSDHVLSAAAFTSDAAALKQVVENAQADIVFNLVESVNGDGLQASIVSDMLEKLGVRYTGAGTACMALTADKIRSKHVLRAEGLPTADWAEPPLWEGLAAERLYVVKSVTEDASLGLDDGAVVAASGVRDRAQESAERYGGCWFAEAYLEGREFNVALLEEGKEIRVLPIPEMCFEAWATHRPRIVGYAAKWDEASEDSKNTVRTFGVADEEPALARRLAELALRTWHLFGMRGYARIDFRLDADGAPMILEANPNPCLEPHAGFAAAAAHAGIPFGELVDRIVQTAYRD